MSESESSSVSAAESLSFDGEFDDDVRALVRSNQAPKINKAGLVEKLDEFKFGDLEFIETQVVVGNGSAAPNDADDDLQREFIFYERALESVAGAEEQFNAAGIPYIRPNDYFAEMMKSDKHMLRVKAHLLKSKQRIDEGEKKKRDRELKKLGKQVQVEKVKEKAMQKNAQFTAVKKWREKRKRGEGDEFDLALLDEAARLDGKGVKRPKPMPNARRQAKNAKYGSGPIPKGRNFKSNTSESSSSMKGFSQRRNKTLFGATAPKGGGAKKRPGKRTRQKNRK